MKNNSIILCDGNLLFYYFMMIMKLKMRIVFLSNHSKVSFFFWKTTYYQNYFCCSQKNMLRLVFTHKSSDYRLTRRSFIWLFSFSFFVYIQQHTTTVIDTVKSEGSDRQKRERIKKFIYFYCSTHSFSRTHDQL